MTTADTLVSTGASNPILQAALICSKVQTASYDFVCVCVRACVRVCEAIFMFFKVNSDTNALQNRFSSEREWSTGISTMQNLQNFADVEGEGGEGVSKYSSEEEPEPATQNRRKSAATDWHL